MFTLACTTAGCPATEMGTYMNTLRVTTGDAGTFVWNVSSADTRVPTVVGKTGMETSCVRVYVLVVWKDSLWDMAFTPWCNCFWKYMINHICEQLHCQWTIAPESRLHSDYHACHSVSSAIGLLCLANVTCPVTCTHTQTYRHTDIHTPHRTDCHR